MIRETKTIGVKLDAMTTAPALAARAIAVADLVLAPVPVLAPALATGAATSIDPAAGRLRWLGVPQTAEKMPAAATNSGMVLVPATADGRAIMVPRLAGTRALRTVSAARRFVEVRVAQNISRHISLVLPTDSRRMKWHN